MPVSHPAAAPKFIIAVFPRMSSVSLNLAVIRIERVYSSPCVSSAQRTLVHGHYSVTQRFLGAFKEHSRRRDAALTFYNRQRMNILGSKLQHCTNRKGPLMLLFSPGVSIVTSLPLVFSLKQVARSIWPHYRFQAAHKPRLFFSHPAFHPASGFPTTPTGPFPLYGARYWPLRTALLQLD